MYTCEDHDFQFGHYQTWFFRVYFVRCANENCNYEKQLGTVWRWRRRRPPGKRKFRPRE